MTDGHDQGILKRGTLRCRVGGIDVDETTALVLWPMVAMNPISYEEYKATSPKNPTYTQSFSDMLAAAYHRYGLASLLAHRGACSRLEAFILLYDLPGDRLYIEQRVSIWLRKEFQKLATGRESSGASPVRRRGLLSPLDIADLAIAMLDYDCNHDEKPPPTKELVDLLGLLLGVNRHRNDVANSDKHSRKFSLAAQIDGQAALQGKTIPVRQLAKLASMSIGTIVNWRQSSRYKELVEFEKQRPFLREPPPP
jgi:hypothetical protein